jgi:hypothetical protein
MGHATDKDPLHPTIAPATSKTTVQDTKALPTNNAAKKNKDYTEKNKPTNAAYKTRKRK